MSYCFCGRRVFIVIDGASSDGSDMLEMTAVAVI